MAYLGEMGFVATWTVSIIICPDFKTAIWGVYVGVPHVRTNPYRSLVSWVKSQKNDVQTLYWLAEWIFPHLTTNQQRC